MAGGAGDQHFARGLLIFSEKQTTVTVNALLAVQRVSEGKDSFGYTAGELKNAFQTPQKAYFRRH